MPQTRLTVVASLAPAVLAVVVPVMAQESGMGWQLGISGEQAMAGPAEYAWLIRAEADRVMPAGVIRMPVSVTGEESEQFRTSYPAYVHPVEAFAACPHCKTPPHYPLIVGRLEGDGALCLIRECMYCHNTWTQQEPA